MRLIPVEYEGLLYYRSEQIHTPHGFTTRLGGVSTGIFESLNLNFSRGDDPRRVVENFRRMGRALGFAPEDAVNARQTHSDIVVRVGKEHRGVLDRPGASPECDAMITDEPGLALYVSTADCTPILLWDPDTGAVGAVHAGWRGTVSAIVRKTVEAMVREFGSDPGRIRGAIGPNADVCCFETDADVPQALLEAFGEAVRQWIEPRGEKYYVNLKEINGWLLRSCGVTRVDISDQCTMCRPELFWSHRLTRGQRGAQGGIILCKGEGL